MKKLLFPLFVAVAVASVYGRETINLAGTWSFSTSPDRFTDTVTLPGTMDTNGKGEPHVAADITGGLWREKCYEGSAYYSREVTIPDSWRGSNITLLLERTRSTTVSVDGVEAGSCRYLSVPHVYDLTAYLTPGRHLITVMVDNGDSIPVQVRTSSHACAESTQTNWNGIIGRIELTSKPACHVGRLDFYPDVEHRSLLVKASLSVPYNKKKGTLLLCNGNHEVKVRLRRGDREATGILQLGDTACLWSEHSPARHRVTAILDENDTLTAYAALRDFKVAGRHFAVNDSLTFLRGRHDACVFPLTGFPPMDVDAWRDYFRTIKDYGLNHVRFHSWCPPEACFEAADIEGVYLQPELTVWGAFDREAAMLMDYLRADGEQIQRCYGNHPSFAMFGLGNELWGDVELMKEFADHFREIDSRHLYTYGSNAFLGRKGNLPGQEFWVTCRTGDGDGYSTHTRASFSFFDADEGGYLNNTYPNTLMNFEDAVLRSPVPVVGHETGQFQIYPDYSELSKYTGVLKPRNFLEFKRRLDSARLGCRAHDFMMASGKWAVELYKADIEMNLRTPSMAGFQLLDIQDYPGQGTALVGILDAFMDTKGLVVPERWRQWCAPVVVMAEFPSYCVTEGDTIRFAISCANYGNMPLAGKPVEWTLSDGDKAFASGSYILDGGAGYTRSQPIAAEIPADGEARKLSLSLKVPGTDVANAYSLWAYPDENSVDMADILVTDTLGADVRAALEGGRRVLLAPRREMVDSTTVGPLFQTDYWNYRMFKSASERNNRPVSPGTMGIINDPAHPALAAFPNDGHTDWQWYSIVKASYPLILDRLNDIDYCPVVQVIDNIERNHRLGLVMEFAVGTGKLLLVMADLDKVNAYPEGRQFVRSLSEYMCSSDFEPATSVSYDDLTELLTVPEAKAAIGRLRNISYE